MILAKPDPSSCKRLPSILEYILSWVPFPSRCNTEERKEQVSFWQHQQQFLLMVLHSSFFAESLAGWSRGGVVKASQYFDKSSFVCSYELKKKMQDAVLDIYRTLWAHVAFCVFVLSFLGRVENTKWGKCSPYSSDFLSGFFGSPPAPRHLKPIWHQSDALMSGASIQTGAYQPGLILSQLCCLLTEQSSLV